MGPGLLTSFLRHVRAGRRGRTGAMVAIGALLCVTTASPTLSQAPGVGATTNAPSAQNVVANALLEASRRFHVPASWLRAVMRAESHGDAKSVSDKGAIGLMQVMPRTYIELRAKYGFGSDPFDPHDNILAGAAYLAEMFARYGSPGFLAAYNAGPRRYEDHLLGGRPLPAETTDYVARLAPELGFASVPAAGITAPPDAHRAPLFVMAAALNIAPRRQLRTKPRTALAGAKEQRLIPSFRRRATTNSLQANRIRTAPRALYRPRILCGPPTYSLRAPGWNRPNDQFRILSRGSAFQSAFARGTRRGSASDQAMAG